MRLVPSAPGRNRTAGRCEGHNLAEDKGNYKRFNIEIALLVFSLLENHYFSAVSY